MVLTSAKETTIEAVNAAIQEVENLEVELYDISIQGLTADNQQAINAAKLNLKQAALWLSQITEK